MKVGIPKEIDENETRVAVVPQALGELTRLGVEVLVESGAGEGAQASDMQYKQAGARVVGDTKTLYREVDLVFKVRPPRFSQALGRHELDLVRDGIAMLGFLDPLSGMERIEGYNKKKLTAFSVELVPRITRAQSMDALSSMATLAGYKAVLLGGCRLGKLMPLMMTAAGTLAPASVLVLGAGVAGLQAIATAKRLGAKVEAFDTRLAVKEQVESLGAKFVTVEIAEDAEGEGGYAKQVSEEFIQKEMEVIGSRLGKTDMLITTAQVFGKRAPLLVTNRMLQLMPAGSVVVDLAAEQGGNCEPTRVGETVFHEGVTVMGPLNLPATVPIHASQMLSVNFVNLYKHLYGSEDHGLDFDDQITFSTCVCHNGSIVSPVVKNAFSF